MSPDSFLARIDRYLARTGTTPTAFGKAAVGDPSLIRDLRNGRSPNLRTIGRVEAFMRPARKRRRKGRK